jgi:hypothetical protein
MRVDLAGSSPGELVVGGMQLLKRVEPPERRRHFAGEPVAE